MTKEIKTFEELSKAIKKICPKAKIYKPMRGIEVHFGGICFEDIHQMKNGERVFENIFWTDTRYAIWQVKNTDDELVYVINVGLEQQLSKIICKTKDPQKIFNVIKAIKECDES